MKQPVWEEMVALARTARKQSESGLYHVVTKGDGGQVIFERAADRHRYLDMLAQSSDDHGVIIHAYCLMGNHVHLLAESDPGGLSACMKQLDERYAMYFCRAAQRVGHVFQGRFWSEPVESEPYLLCALRYIHSNPEPAGICRASEYRWSSYRAYLGDSSFVDTSLALSLIGDAEAFAAFSDPGGRFVSPFPTSRLQRHLSPDELMRVALMLLGRDTLSGLKAMRPDERRPHLASLRDAGFTEREISLITGLGKGSIHHALCIAPPKQPDQPKGTVPFGCC